MGRIVAYNAQHTMKLPGLILVFALGALAVVDGQAGLDAKLQSQLKSLFPNATSFSAKIAEPPHYKAFVGTRSSPQPRRLRLLDDGANALDRGV